MEYGRAGRGVPSGVDLRHVPSARHRVCAGHRRPTRPGRSGLGRGPGERPSSPLSPKPPRRASATATADASRPLSSTTPGIRDGRHPAVPRGLKRGGTQRHGEYEQRGDPEGRRQPYEGAGTADEDGADQEADIAQNGAVGTMTPVLPYRSTSRLNPAMPVMAPTAKASNARLNRPSLSPRWLFTPGIRLVHAPRAVPKSKKRRDVAMRARRNVPRAGPWASAARRARRDEPGVSPLPPSGHSSAAP